MSEMNFSLEYKSILELVESTKKNLFITGKAGTGKSTLLSHISKVVDPSIVVLAPTGIAAINVNGETIHSFFKLKPGYELDEATHVRVDKRMMANYANVHTIIIDEISMLRADILDAIDVFLRRVRNSNDHFGGVRMIFFGDLFQLPPVLKSDQEEVFLSKFDSPYFFSSNVFQQKDLFSEPFVLEFCELTQIYRQKDETFTSILNAIRTKEINEEQLSILNKQVQADVSIDDSFSIQLVSTNAIANRLNQRKLDSIQGPEITFTSIQSGKVDNLKPNDQIINVKVGAQVMFINNDAKRRWVNGSLGEVVAHKKVFDEESDSYYDALEVKLENNKVVKVSPYTWAISKYKFKGNRFMREEIGTFIQIPLKLAWAITIHKSQGKTFNNVVIDLGMQSFAHGQTYVALSRCRKLENIILKRPVKETDILVDEKIVDYYKQF